MVLGLILNTNKIQEKICAEILYMRDCRLDFFQILNGVQYKMYDLFMLANVHIPPPLKHCRLEMLIASLCAFYAEDSFCQENRNWRNSHFFVYEIDFSFSVLPFFVNCAFLAVTDYAIATMHFTVSLKNFALCGERRGTLSPRPLPPFKKRGRKLCFLDF